MVAASQPRGLQLESRRVPVPAPGLAFPPRVLVLSQNLCSEQPGVSREGIVAP